MTKRYSLTQEDNKDTLYNTTTNVHHTLPEGDTLQQQRSAYDKDILLQRHTTQQEDILEHRKTTTTHHTTQRQTYATHNKGLHTTRR